jgi:hypothetical protein
MGFYFILAGTILYLGAGISFSNPKMWPWAVMYYGYAIANFCPLYYSWKG